MPINCYYLVLAQPPSSATTTTITTTASPSMDLSSHIEESVLCDSNFLPAFSTAEASPSGSASACLICSLSFWSHSFLATLFVVAVRFLRTFQIAREYPGRSFQFTIYLSLIFLHEGLSATAFMMFTSLSLLSFILLPILCTGQTVTHISQVPAITDLPCLSQKLVQAYTELRHANCPQPSPLSYASCLCLQPTNSLSISSSMSFWGSFYCADRSSIDSSMAMGVYSSYCDLALKDVAGSTAASSSASTTSSTSVSSCEHPSTCLKFSYSEIHTDSSTRASNIASATPAVTAITAQKTAVPAPTVVTSSTNFSNNTTINNSSSSAGLSVTATILLSTIIPIVALLVTVVGVFLPWRAGRKQRQMSSQAPRPTSVIFGAVQDLRRGYSQAFQSAELHGQERRLS